MTAPALAAGAPARWSRWSRLPREPRDTLFQLAVIGWTIVPHVQHLAGWCTALAYALLGWRAAIALGGRALPSRFTVLMLMALAVGLTLWTERTLFGKEAGVTMLVVLLALKTLELRARRDSLVVFFLGFFLVLTQCLYSQSLFAAIAMAISTAGLLTGQVLVAMPVGKPPLARAAAIAARSTLLGVPVMAALFVLFPRIGPLWGLPQDAIGRTGLSGSLRLGSVAELAADDSIAFRIRFEGDAAPSAALYFRGPVLSQYDGTTWTAAHPALEAATRPPEVRTRDRAYDYQMLIEPIRLALLPLLEFSREPGPGVPIVPEWRVSLRSDLRWQTDRPIGERLRVAARAWPRFEHGSVQSTREVVALTQLPSGRHPRAVAWARDLRSQPRLAGASPDVLAAELMAHIRSHPFGYTLLPGSYDDDTIDEFWFDRRLGFCEHYAASFVVLMRAMGVPARLVTGYQGAEPPDADGWQIVRQSHAHAWAEYWQEGAGWRRADPTAAVAPERIDRSRPLVRPAGPLASALLSVNPELLLRLRRAWELLDNRWNLWVMSYSRSTQFDLLKWLGFAAPSWTDLGVALGSLLSAAAMAGAGWAWWDRHRVDPWTRTHERVRAGLARLGVESRVHEGPRSLAGRVRDQWGPTGEPVAAALDALDRMRYGPAGAHVPDRGWTRRFASEVAACRRQASRASRLR